MEYLDELAELPGGHSFGLLLFKADPIAFNIGVNEWLNEPNLHSGDIRIELRDGRSA